METYEPLKPLAYRRNELGQFDRPGKMLAKTAKVKRSKGELIEKTDKINREIDGRYKNGGARPGAGRPKGSQAKVTVALKEAILRAGEIAGGKEGLTGYLVMLARDNSSAYAGLLAKILPSAIAAEETDGGKPTTITFTRVIVHADGHKEIEGVTPKALPAPDASNALPRPTDPTDDTNEGAV
jgi:hypothetical protein